MPGSCLGLFVVCSRDFVLVLRFCVSCTCISEAMPHVHVVHERLGMSGR